MNHSPYVNYWDDCNKLISLSDQLGSINPIWNNYWLLWSKYDEIELKFYKKFLKFTQLDKSKHSFNWSRIIKIRKQEYRFIFKIDEKEQRCEITFTGL
jgi:hypothetical protein